MIDRETLERIKANPEELVRFVASQRLVNFARYINPKLDMTNFHNIYYDVLDRFAHKKIRRLIISVPPQHGKALQVDTPVLTTNGWKRHGDLEVGDYVFGEDGKPKRIEWVSGNYLWHTMNVDFADGFSLIAAHEHEWELWCDHDDHKGRQKERVETQNIFQRRHRRNPFAYANAIIDMPQRELPIDPYLLGYWLGDGYSCGGWICSGEEDAWNMLQFGDVRRILNGHESPYFKCHIEGLSRLLRLNGLINNKHIPTEYLLASPQQRRELLCGLMDTDGCVDKRGICEFTQKKGQLAEDVYVLLRSLGYKPTKHTYKAMMDGRCVGEKVRICFNPNKGDKIFHLPRKQERIDNKARVDREDKNKFFITNTSENRLEQVNCIQVEGGMYLAGFELVPTHNSEGSTRFLPAFLLGLNPDYKIVLCSYNADQAKSFNRDVQRIINSEAYKAVFPDTFLNNGRMRMDNVYQCNSEVSEPVGHKGFVRAVGRSGALTGKSVDIAILDDVYKDFDEANSALIREQAWKWYTTVVRTRKHNYSQEIIVFTRWHEDDIIGRLEKSNEKIIDATKWSDFDNVPKDAWVRINFPALKVGAKTELDPREEGEALWENKHSRKKLLEQQDLDPVQFQCLFQGNPLSEESMLYGTFKTYVQKSDYGTFVRRGACVDVADKGTDFLCSICYDIYKSPNMVFNEKKHRYEPILFALVTDVLYTQEGTEITTNTLPMQLSTNGTQKAYIESNAGGSIYAREVAKRVRCQVETFFSHTNKEARIISNAGLVMQSIVFPVGWETRWEKFHNAVTHFVRVFIANKNDDAPDCLSSIVIHEIADGNTKPYSQMRRGVKRRN